MSERGFALIEIIVIILLLGVMVPGIILYFIYGTKDSADSQQRTTAIFLAEGLMEEVRSKRWDENSPGMNPLCTNASAVLGAEGETRNLYDDTDDFNGLNNAPPRDSQGNVMTDYAGFSRQVLVSYVDAADLNSPVAGPTCYKHIRVSVAHQLSGETVDMVSLRAVY